MNALILAIALITPQEATISKVDSQRTFAGALGYKVSVQLTVNVNGESKAITVSPYHTVPSHNRTFKVGQKIKFSGKTHVSLSDLR